MTTELSNSVNLFHYDAGLILLINTKTNIQRKIYETYET